MIEYATKADIKYASELLESRLRADISGLKAELYKAMAFQTLAILGAVFAIVRWLTKVRLALLAKRHLVRMPRSCPKRSSRFKLRFAQKINQESIAAQQRSHD